ncbi:MAG TPA: SIMPL domain-containing protein [Herpetosiphonaceae bacterium]
MSDPDIITVNAMHTEEIAANEADLLVTIRGSSLISSDSALRKAREVRQLVQALEALGVGEEAVELREVHADVHNGLLGTSSAQYNLKIRCERLEQLADLIGAVTALKQASLSAIQWRYPDDEAAQHRWLDLCLRQANERARVMAAALGVSLLGVRKVSTSYEANDHQAQRGYQYQFPTASRAKSQSLFLARPAPVTSADLGLSIQHRKTVATRAEVEYRIGDYRPADPAAEG